MNSKPIREYRTENVVHTRKPVNKKTAPRKKVESQDKNGDNEQNAA